MSTSTETSKGQITLPRDVRQALGLGVGDKVDFVEFDGGFKLVPSRKDVRALKGRFAGRVKRPVTIAEMDDAIAQATAESKVGSLDWTQISLSATSRKTIQIRLRVQPG